MCFQSFLDLGMSGICIQRGKPTVHSVFYSTFTNLFSLMSRF